MLINFINQIVLQCSFVQDSAPSWWLSKQSLIALICSLKFNYRVQSVQLCKSIRVMTMYMTVYFWVQYKKWYEYKMLQASASKVDFFLAIIIAIERKLLINRWSSIFNQTKFYLVKKIWQRFRVTSTSRVSFLKFVWVAFLSTRKSSTLFKKNVLL